MTARRRSAVGNPGSCFSRLSRTCAVGLDDLADPPRRGLVALVDRRRGDQALDVEVVRICQEPHHRLRIVGFVLDVGQHEHARLVCHGLGARRWRFGEAGEPGGNQRDGCHTCHGWSLVTSRRRDAITARGS